MRPKPPHSILVEEVASHVRSYCRGELDRAAINRLVKTAPNKFAGIKEYFDPANVVGAQATIKARRTNVCGEFVDTDSYSASAALVGVAYDTIGFREHNAAWALSGITTVRFDGEDFTQMIALSEMYGSDNPVHQIWDADYLTEGEIYWFVTEQGYGPGVWRSFIDGEQIGNSLHPSNAFWTALAGDNARFFGEIFHFECDMPGTPPYPCTFGGCRYKIGTEWHSTELQTGDTVLMNDNSSEWFVIVVDEDSLEIGDLDTLQL